MKGVDTMEELKIFNESSWTSPDEIANTLQELSLTSNNDEITKPLTDVIYQLRTDAQNKYNDDKWRIFYNILERITENYIDLQNNGCL